ncbi:hypothetical protein ACFQQB_35915 [Nonomuraea rubra]|uniref:hypothetical protein n=1 Tax=Nonomuraea rubra TaxID=46180 RepID=UPI00361D30D3
MRTALFRTLVLVVLVLLWEAATRLAANPFFPPPSTIVSRMHAMWFSGPVTRGFLTDLAVGNILPSLGRMALGFAGARWPGSCSGWRWGCRRGCTTISTGCCSSCAPSRRPRW